MSSTPLGNLKCDFYTRGGRERHYVFVMTVVEEYDVRHWMSRDNESGQGVRVQFAKAVISISHLVF
jgi:hypothetical protein